VFKAFPLKPLYPPDFAKYFGPPCCSNSVQMPPGFSPPFSKGGWGDYIFFLPR
jgi:hypothetical protein